MHEMDPQEWLHAALVSQAAAGHPEAGEAHVPPGIPASQGRHENSSAPADTQQAPDGSASRAWDPEEQLREPYRPATPPHGGGRFPSARPRHAPTRPDAPPSKRWPIARVVGNIPAMKRAVGGAFRLRVEELENAREVYLRLRRDFINDWNRLRESDAAEDRIAR
ncbi:hypothetical protein KEM52_004996, partial [Ascosphaera acerosa]